MGLEGEPGRAWGSAATKGHRSQRIGWTTKSQDKRTSCWRFQKNRGGGARLTRFALRRGADRKDLRLPRFHITYIGRLACQGHRQTGACCVLSAWGNRHNSLPLVIVASRLLKGATLSISKIFDSIQNWRLRTGSKIRAGFLYSDVEYLLETRRECGFLLVSRQFRQ